MQRTHRLLATLSTTASAGQAARYLTPGNPTGLAGLATHPSPRSTLIYLYASTLAKLRASFPESSAYRASAEALTRHRLAAVQAVEPEGHGAWCARASALIAEHPRELGKLADGFASSSSAEEGGERKVQVADFVEGRIWERKKAMGRRYDEEERKEEEVDDIEWDGEQVVQYPEGGDANVGEIQAPELLSDIEARKVNWESAPSLEARQISEIEQKIGAGLIEEVIEVARGELRLANEMAESKPWEELVEKSPQGQWEYFAREQHMPGHQEPGNK